MLYDSLVEAAAAAESDTFMFIFRPETEVISVVRQDHKKVVNELGMHKRRGETNEEDVGGHNVADRAYNHAPHDLDRGNYILSYDVTGSCSQSVSNWSSGKF